MAVGAGGEFVGVAAPQGEHAAQACQRHAGHDQKRRALAEMPGEDQAAGTAAEEADHHPGDLYRVDLGQQLAAEVLRRHAVGGDVLGRAGQRSQRQQANRPTGTGHAEAERRQAEQAGEDDALHRQDPATPPAETARPMVVDPGRPEELDHPGQPHQGQEGQRLQWRAILAQEGGQGVHGQADGNALGQVEQRQGDDQAAVAIQLKHGGLR